MVSFNLAATTDHLKLKFKKVTAIQLKNIGKQYGCAKKARFANIHHKPATSIEHTNKTWCTYVSAVHIPEDMLDKEEVTKLRDGKKGLLYKLD